MRMIPRSPERADDVLETALRQAADEAAWERADLAARRPADLVEDLLTARADELAASPGGRDQLRGMVLRTLANPAPSEPRLGADPGEAARLALRREVYAIGGLPIHETSDLVAQLEARYREAIGPDANPAVLAARLLADADLHEALWDDPRIPAENRARLVMLCSVAKLRDRADELQRSVRGFRAMVARAPLIGAMMRRR